MKKTTKLFISLGAIVAIGLSGAGVKTLADGLWAGHSLNENTKVNMNKVKNNYDNKVNQLKDANAKLTDAKQALQKAIKNNDDNATALKDLQQQLQTTKDDLANANNNSASLNNQLKAKEGELDQKIAEVNDKIAEGNKKVAEKQAELNRVQANNNVLQQENEKLKGELASSQQDNANLNQALSEAKTVNDQSASLVEYTSK